MPWINRCLSQGKDHFAEVFGVSEAASACRSRCVARAAGGGCLRSVRSGAGEGSVCWMSDWTCTHTEGRYMWIDVRGGI